MAQVMPIESQDSIPQSPIDSIYGSNTSASSVEDLTPESNKAPASSIHKYTTYTIEDHLSTLRSIQNDDFSNEKGIDALPRRRNKSQRPLALELSKALFPEMTEIAAIIQYERLTNPAKAIVNQNQKERAIAQVQPTNNCGGKLLKIQGPWAGQELDPVDLKGPVAIPMPVTIGDASEFEPIFEFLAENKAITEAGDVNGTHGLELLWKNPTLEFKRGIVYEDGRLDLCKKVVGPTHIGKLMESLESNEHIRHFLLGNNAISTTGAKHIAEFIRKYPNRMETWYLAGCHLTRHGLSLLAPHIMASTSITNLWFKRNPFRPNSSSILSELVLRTANLRTLDLETTELGDEGARQFIDGICGRPNSLQHLYLNANGIGQNACASLAKYLADPHCKLESLFISTNPIGDAGIQMLAPGIMKNKTLKRLTCASAGLTSKGVTLLANALTDGAGHPYLQALDLGASQTTVAHRQKFNYLDDDCVEALKPLIMLPSLRWLNLGRTVLTATGLQSINHTAAQSQLVYLNAHRVQMTKKTNTTSLNTKTEMYEGSNPVTRSCSLEVRNRMARNQAKYYPHIPDYDNFLSSEEMRFLRNTSDVRKIDSMYRTINKRLEIDDPQEWDEGDVTWKLIVDDARNAEIADGI